MAGKPIALVNPITPTDQEAKKCGLIEADADLRKPLCSRCYPRFYLALHCLSPRFLVDVRLSKRAAKAHLQIQIIDKIHQNIL